MTNRNSTNNTGTESNDRCHKDNVEIILCESLPRSGHHFLIEKMIKEYLKNEVLYCEFYPVPDCCMQVPCKKAYSHALNNKYFLQKSHDFSIEDPYLENYKYIIQYRHPIPLIQSYYEYELERTQDVDNKHKFIKFLKTRADYYVGFYNKWINNPPPSSILILYEDLVLNVEKSVSAVIHFITGATVDHDILKTVTRDKHINFYTEKNIQ